MTNSALNDLSQELARIIACPYPATLAGLLDRDERTLRSALHHLSPCAIVRLGSIVSAALSLWPYSLRVLHDLCHSPEFRDAILHESPGLLEALLNKANASKQQFDQYAELCVLLLSRPLPKGMPLPAAADKFFLRLFSRAVETPEVASLKPIYLVLNGACRGLLPLLSPEIRQSIDEELCRILQSNSTTDRSMLLLWCFGIVILIEHPDDVGKPLNSLSTSNGSSNWQWKTASGRKLFGSPSGLVKTINLMYLSVIWASKGDVGVTDLEAVEGIRIATRAVQFIDQNVREGWRFSNEVAGNIAFKLASKILRTGIDQGVQLEALAFYANIVGSKALSEKVVASYESLLMRLKTFAVDIDSLKETLSFSLPYYADRLPGTAIRRLLVQILEVSVSSRHPYELGNIRALVEVLGAVIRSSESMAAFVTEELCSRELQSCTRAFLDFSADSQPREGEVCATGTSLLLRGLRSDILAMILTAGFLCPSDRQEMTPTFALALIQKQQEISSGSIQCNHSVVRGRLRPAVSLFEQGCTPATGAQRLDWREHLTTELERQSSYQRDSVIRSVAQICQNLENRCNDVEEPLRREQAKVKELTSQVSELREQAQSLQKDSEEQDYLIQNLQKETTDGRLYADGLEAEVENMEKEKEDLTTRLEALKAELADEISRAEETLRSTREAFNVKEEQLRSVILAREGDLQSRNQDIERMEAQIQSLQDEVHSERAGKDELDSLYDALKAKLDSVEEQLRIEHQNAADQAEELRQLRSASGDLEKQLMTAKQEADQQRRDFEAQHQNVVRTSAQALEDVEAKCEALIQAAKSKAEDEKHKLQEELQNAVNEGLSMKAAYEKTMRHLELVQTELDSLDVKVQELTEACAEKDEELYGLKSWRRGILESMPRIAETPLPKRTSRPSNINKSDTTKPSLKAGRRLRPRTSELPPQTTAPTPAATGQGITSTVMENVANPSFTSTDSPRKHGSTPKRPRPRPSFKVPAMHTPAGGRPEPVRRSTRKHVSPAKRTALGAISPNRRHTTVGFAVEEQEEHEEEAFEAAAKRRVSLQVGTQTQASFDMDAFLTASTPFTPGKVTCGTGRAPEEDYTSTEL